MGRLKKSVEEARNAERLKRYEQTLKDIKKSIAEVLQDLKAEVPKPEVPKPEVPPEPIQDEGEVGELSDEDNMGEGRWI